MVAIASLLHRLHSVKIAVVGDLLLDMYTKGKTQRISPEAPVAIVSVQREEYLPGGSGNVILNLISLGAQVVAVGRVGKDSAGDRLRAALCAEKVDIKMILSQEGYQTPIKNRIMVDHQQIVRIDHEQILSLDREIESYIIAQIPLILADVKVVAISDYGKGFLTPTLLSAFITFANQKGIVVITDPKGQDFTKYKGTTWIKPNLSEAYLAARLSSHFSLEEAAVEIMRQTDAQSLMITRSEHGISVFDVFMNRYDFPVQIKEVRDVTGAGDTVLAMLAYTIANNVSLQEAIQLCNLAASLAIEHVGCARVTLSDLVQQAYQREQSCKMYEKEKLFILKEFLKGKEVKLLFLPPLPKFNYLLLKAIKNLIDGKEYIIIYIDKKEVNEELIEILSSLQEVHFIITEIDSAHRLCQIPVKTYSFDPLEMHFSPTTLECILA